MVDKLNYSHRTINLSVKTNKMVGKARNTLFFFGDIKGIISERWLQSYALN